MQDAQILKLDLIERINNLPTEALRQVSEFITSVETQFVSFYKKEQEHVEEQTQESLPEKYQAVQQELSEVYGYKPDEDDDIFVDDITWDEYFAMSDQAQSQLWDKLEADVTIELEELEVPSHVLPV